MKRAKFNGITKILCIGAHADDIEIGCGGALLQLLDENPELSVHWVILSAAEERTGEARRSAELFLRKAGESRVDIEQFPDTRFPEKVGELKDFFKRLVTEVEPDLIFTHRLEDRHQDHRLVAEMTWQTFRDHTILEYEIPKYEGDLAQPNVLFDLSEDACERKLDYLLSSFTSQREKPWFDADTFRAILRLRGIEAKSAGGFAEGFHCRKLVF